MMQARSETLKQIILGLVIVVLLGIGCILVLSSLITKPIKQLAKGVEELKLGIRSEARG